MKCGVRAGVMLMTTLVLAAPAAAQRQPQAGPTLRRLLAAVRPGDAHAVSAFWDSIGARGTPLIDPDPADSTRILAQFVHRADSIVNVILENGVNGWAYIKNQLERVEGTDIWHITVSVPNNIRLGYVMRENDSLVPWHLEQDRAKRWAANRPDPFNGQMDSAQGRRSVLLGPEAAADTLSLPRAGVPRGTLTDLELESTALDTTRKFSVYLPPAATADLPLLVVFDGPIYRHVVRLPTILDNLIAARLIQPVVAVFVDQIDRMTELPPNENFTQFITGELIPFVRQRHGLSTDPAKTILMGSSHGGLAATWLALAHPEVAAGVISQSASLWWSPPDEAEPEFLARFAAREPRRPVRFWLEVGSFEVDRTANGGPGQVDVSRHFRNVLQARGYDVVYSEFPGGHEYQSWRVTTPDALRHFLGTGH